VGIIVRQERGGVQGRDGGRWAAIVEPSARNGLHLVDSISVARDGGNLGEGARLKIKRGQNALWREASPFWPIKAIKV
jgi:hypothetical protein